MNALRRSVGVLVGVVLPLCALVTVGLCVTAPASAMGAAPVWKLYSYGTSTSAAPGEIVTVYLDLENEGDAGDDGTPLSLKVDLAQGLTPVDIHTYIGGSGTRFDCSEVLAGTADTCSGHTTEQVEALEPFGGEGGVVTLDVRLDPGVSGILTSTFRISGGGSKPATGANRITVAPAPSFGFDAFDSQATDLGGNAMTQAGGHPDQISTNVLFNSIVNPHHQYLGESFPPLWQQEWDGPAPVEPPKNIYVDLPPGLIGNLHAAGIAECDSVALANGINQEPRPLCPPSSQVGTAWIWAKALSGPGMGRASLFNMVPPPGVAASFGFQYLGTIVLLDAHVRSGGDYGITVSSRNTPASLAVVGSTVTFWGVPAASSHDKERSCPGKTFAEAHCTSSAPEVAILRNPTSCTPLGKGLTWSAHMDSYAHPGRLDASDLPDTSDPAWANSSFESHEHPGFPFPRSQWGRPTGTSGCDLVPFSPSLSVTPTTRAADSPSGLDVSLSIPQESLQARSAISQADLKDIKVTLPQGMTVNPSAAAGLGACSPSQIALNTSQPAHCPDSAKVGSVTIDTPLLGEPLEGSVYVASQTDNPFHSLLAMYLVAEGSGVVVKQAGEIMADPSTGQLTTVFREAPQTPFSDLNLRLFGGSHAVLRSPRGCGGYESQATLTPWSGKRPVQTQSSFQITQRCGGGFDPKLAAGTQNPLAGSYSPLSLRLNREDGTEPITGLSAHLPEGLLASLRGVATCPDATLAAISTELGTGVAQEAHPSCPAASQIGTVTVGAGSGPTPFYTDKARIYFAGPYRGAPYSLAVVAPAVAGPFDLGNVVVRNAINIDPVTTKITVDSDPIPTIVHGIPLDLRDVRVDVDRPGFTLNPTSCDPMAVTGTLTALQGASANVSNRFQVGGCERLGFKPKLALRLKGKTKRGGTPALRATLKMPAGGANIARASIALPHSEFLDNAHIKTICTRVQYAAGGGGGAGCPAASVYGHATAWSPLLDQPLSGPVYLRSSSHELPDLVASLDGQIHVDLDGTIDSVHGGIRNRFELVPDAPVTKFVLTMQGGSKGLLENSTNICRATNRATAKFDAQSGKTHDFRPVLQADCAKAAK